LSSGQTRQRTRDAQSLSGRGVRTPYRFRNTRVRGRPFGKAESGWRERLSVPGIGRLRGVVRNHTTGSMWSACALTLLGQTKSSDRLATDLTNPYTYSREDRINARITPCAGHRGTLPGHTDAALAHRTKYVPTEATRSMNSNQSPTRQVHKSLATQYRASTKVMTFVREENLRSARHLQRGSAPRLSELPHRKVRAEKEEEYSDGEMVPHHRRAFR
jgi:hypothetical protein